MRFGSSRPGECKKTLIQASREKGTSSQSFPQCGNEDGKGGKGSGEGEREKGGELKRAIRRAYQNRPDHNGE